MSAYFFHFRTAQGALLVDRIGSEFETDEAALHEGSTAAAELMVSTTPAIAGGAFEIHDEGGWLVERLPVWRH